MNYGLTGRCTGSCVSILRMSTATSRNSTPTRKWARTASDTLPRIADSRYRSELQIFALCARRLTLHRLNKCLAAENVGPDLAANPRTVKESYKVGNERGKDRLSIADLLAKACRCRLRSAAKGAVPALEHRERQVSATTCFRSSLSC